eukprot:Partr_v1_DN29016_c0_g1_i5_m58690 putative bardet-biedl syndrome 9
MLVCESSTTIADESFNSESVCVVRFDKLQSDLIVTGSTEGVLRVYSTVATEHSVTCSTLIEVDMAGSIQSVSCSSYLQSSFGQTIAILCNDSLIFAAVKQTAFGYDLDILRKVGFNSSSAFNMCEAADTSIAIQFVDGRIQLLANGLLTTIRESFETPNMPGPLAYHNGSNSIITGDIRFNIVSTRLTSIETYWTGHTGELPLEIFTIPYLNDDLCDIVVIGEKHMFVFNDDGTLAIRMQFVCAPVACRAVQPTTDPRNNVILLDCRGTISVYRKKALIFSSQLLSFNYIAFRLGSFEPLPRGMIVTLQSNGLISIQYPSANVNNTKHAPEKAYHPSFEPVWREDFKISITTSVIPEQLHVKLLNHSPNAVKNIGVFSGNKSHLQGSDKECARMDTVLSTETCVVDISNVSWPALIYCLFQEVSGLYRCVRLKATLPVTTNLNVPVATNDNGIVLNFSANAKFNLGSPVTSKYCHTIARSFDGKHYDICGPSLSDALPLIDYCFESCSDISLTFPDFALEHILSAAQDYQNCKSAEEQARTETAEICSMVKQFQIAMIGKIHEKNPKNLDGLDALSDHLFRKALEKTAKFRQTCYNLEAASLFLHRTIECVFLLLKASFKLSYEDSRLLRSVFCPTVAVLNSAKFGWLECVNSGIFHLLRGHLSLNHKERSGKMTDIWITVQLTLKQSSITEFGRPW